MNVARRVHRRRHLVAYPTRTDDERLPRAEGVWDTDNGFQGVSLSATGRRAVGRFVAHPDVVVEYLAHDLGRYARAVVRNGEIDRVLVSSHLNIYLGWHAFHLAGIYSVLR